MSSVRTAQMPPASLSFADPHVAPDPGTVPDPGVVRPQVAPAPQSVVALAPAAVAPAAPPPAQPAAHADVAGLTQLLGSMGPGLLVAVLEARARDAQAASHGTSVRSAEALGELAETERQKAVHAAEKAARKSHKRLGLRGRIAKIVKALTTLVAVAASIVSGGAAAGLAVAGLALVYGAPLLTKGLVKAGVVPEKDAPWVELGLRVAGMALCAAADSTVASGPNMIDAAETLRRVGSAIDGAGDTIDGGLQMNAVALDREHANAMADADAASVQQQAASDRMQEAIDALREMFATFGRVHERLQAGLAAQDNARMAATQILA